jgi:hypothetical protein
LPASGVCGASGAAPLDYGDVAASAAELVTQPANSAQTMQPSSRAGTAARLGLERWR